MAIDEARRHTLYQRLREELGDEVTTTLMEHIPWTEPATREDLENLEHRLVALLERRLTSVQRTYFIATVTVILTLAALNYATTQAILTAIQAAD
jgi:hypothetical protein